MNNEAENKLLKLKRHPEGVAGPGDFECETGPMPSPAEGDVLVETHYVGLDAALRLIVRDSDEFLFRVQPGDLVFGSVAGQIIESRNPDWRVGEFVSGSLGVQRYALSNGDGLERCDVDAMPLSSWLGGYGVSGLTAYFALYEVCKPQPGQTVLVTGAAGAVGSMVGQFAKLAGARAVGLAGGPEKCAWLVDELGYDVAIDYRATDWRNQLEAATPNLADIIFDNVGGDIFDTTLKRINMQGVALLCGSVSQYVADEMQGPSNYVHLGTMRARLQGFVVYDYAEQFPVARQRMADWTQTGKLKMPEHIVKGDIDSFPEAFQQLYNGANRGKMLLDVRG